MLTVWEPSSSVAQRLHQMEVAGQPTREPLLAAKPRRRSDQILPVESQTVQVSGQKIEVWNDEAFGRLRRRHGVPDDFLNVDRENSVDMTHARSETKLGKGGEMQYNSRDSKYIVKSVSGDDHKSLMLRGEAYAERLVQGKSLLVPIYLHFRVLGREKAYIAMSNLTSEDVAWDEKYDLKGCADDKTVMRNGKFIEPVRKRFYSPLMWCRCNWTAKRHIYFEGKVRARAFHFDFPKSQRDEIVQLVQGDAQWLIDQGLMDYSLFVAIRRVPKSQAQLLVEPGSMANGASSSAVRHWAMIDGESAVLVTLSIIDFLQPWTAAKKVARCIKSLEFNKATIPPIAYGERFKRHFAERLRGVERLKPIYPADVADANHGATEA